MSRSVMYSAHVHAAQGGVGRLNWHLTRSIHETGGRGFSGTVAEGSIQLAGEEDARDALALVLLDIVGFLREDEGSPVRS